MKEQKYYAPIYACAACAACAHTQNKAGAQFSNSTNPLGARVMSVTQGGAFQRAGIDPGDVVLTINNRTINNTRDAEDAIAAAPTGVAVAVNVVDVKTGQTVTIWVTF